NELLGHGRGGGRFILVVLHDEANAVALAGHFQPSGLIHFVYGHLRSLQARLPDHGNAACQLRVQTDDDLLSRSTPGPSEEESQRDDCPKPADPCLSLHGIAFPSLSINVSASCRISLQGRTEIINYSIQIIKAL